MRLKGLARVTEVKGDSSFKVGQEYDYGSLIRQFANFISKYGDMVGVEGFDVINISETEFWLGAYTKSTRDDKLGLFGVGFEFTPYAYDEQMQSNIFNDIDDQMY